MLSSIDVMVRLHKRAKSIRRKFEPCYLDQTTYKPTADIGLNESLCKTLCLRNQSDGCCPCWLWRISYGIYPKSKKSWVLSLIFPDVASLLKPKCGTSMTDIQCRCYKFLYHKKRSSPFNRFDCWWTISYDPE